MQKLITLANKYWRAGIVALVMMTAVVVACEVADVGAPRNQGPTIKTQVTLQIIQPQVGDDTLGFIFAWPEVVPGRRQQDVAGYNTELYDDTQGNLVDQGFVANDGSAFYSDTLWSAMPPLDEQQHARACVQTEDVIGQTSNWTCRVLPFILHSLGPTAPDSIVVDTIPVPAASMTVPVPPGISAIELYPDGEITVGYDYASTEGIKLCWFWQFPDGAWEGPDGLDEYGLATPAAAQDSVDCWQQHYTKYGTDIPVVVTDPSTWTNTLTLSVYQS